MRLATRMGFSAYRVKKYQSKIAENFDIIFVFIPFGFSIVTCLIGLYCGFQFITETPATPVTPDFLPPPILISILLFIVGLIACIMIFYLIGFVVIVLLGIELEFLKLFSKTIQSLMQKMAQIIYARYHPHARLCKKVNGQIRLLKRERRRALPDMREQVDLRITSATQFLDTLNEDADSYYEELEALLLEKKRITRDAKRQKQLQAQERKDQETARRIEHSRLQTEAALESVDLRLADLAAHLQDQQEARDSFTL